MTPERFQQIEELYQAARESTAAERAVLLAHTDPELRREVESLLAQGSGVEFLNQPAIQNAPELLEDLAPTDVAGPVNLGPYRIESKLGEGGMGEVFRAIDTRLGRAVAIKTTREQFTARFEREARAISSLNHPHICTVYDVGANYLVMELVEGETISALLKQGPLPVKTALLYASQIAAALAEAHSKRIIHRDLKPGNIMIAKSGVKVLDFGLAKLGQDETVTASHMVMGTPAYMAPEQREGKPADARSDIYSFGCVLYEMLTGARVGSRRKPCPSRKLESIVTRCLEEDPARRWQSATELERELAACSAPASGRRRIVAAGAAILVLSAAAYLYFHRAPKLTSKDTIVLADFDNKTGDPVFDDTLRMGLSVELQQSPTLTLISDRKVQQTMALLGQPKDAKVTPELAQQICERTGSAAVLEGSIARVGSQYVLGLRAKNCSTGNILDHKQATATTREDVLKSLNELARKFRTGAGESLANIEKHSVPLEEVTTRSIEALKAYSASHKINMYAGFAPAAMSFLRRAVDLDPEFAAAHAYLGFGYYGIGESELAVQHSTKAWQLRGRVSDRERFFIEWIYDRQVTGNLEKAYQTLDAWLEAQPGEYEPHPLDLLGGISSHGTGQYERVIEVAKKRMATDPDFMYAHTNLALAYFYTDRLSEAESTLQHAVERKIEPVRLHVLLYTLAAFRNDKDQMDRIVTLSNQKNGADHHMAHAEALALARSGQFQAARRASNRAVDLALQKGERETAACYRAAHGGWEAICGNAAEGQMIAAAVLELSKGKDAKYAAGLALGFSGNGSRSEALAGDLEKRFPEDTFVKFTYVPVLRGLAALDRGKPAEAVERLNTALPYERAVNGLNFGNFYQGSLHSAYARGEAFMALRRYKEAVAEFQKVRDHRGLVGLDAIGVLAHLQLGRVYTLSGDKAKAKSEYESFLTLWKDADADIPILKQAKAEYAKLK